MSDGVDNTSAGGWRSNPGTPSIRDTHSKGFRYAAYAAALCAPSQDRLLLVTKWLYPDVADHFGTSWSCVERDLRTVIAVAWERNPALLANLAQYPLDCKPSCAQFIAILAYYLRSIGDDPVPSISSPNLHSK